jgi:hypothetical protein
MHEGISKPESNVWETSWSGSNECATFRTGEWCMAEDGILLDYKDFLCASHFYTLFPAVAKTWEQLKEDPPWCVSCIATSIFLFYDGKKWKKDSLQLWKCSWNNRYETQKSSCTSAMKYSTTICKMENLVLNLMTATITFCMIRNTFIKVSVTCDL